MSLTEQEQQLLKRLCRLLLPADPFMGLPGGDEQEIFGRLLNRLAPRADWFSKLLQSQYSMHDRLLSMSDEDFEARCAASLRAWPSKSDDLLARLITPLLQSYYEDYRVQTVYQRRPGAPFPEGYTVIQGDWSLLDDVKSRPSIYRQVRS